MTVQTIRQGDILKTPKFDEPMRVINEPRVGNGYVLVDLVGIRTQSFRGGVFLTSADLQNIEIEVRETGPDAAMIPANIGAAGRPPDLPVLSQKNPASS